MTLRCRIRDHDPGFGLTRLEAGGATFLVPGAMGAPGDSVRIRVPAADVSLARSAAADSTILNILPARILGQAARDPQQVTVVLGLGPDGSGPRLLSRITRHSWEALGLAPGQTVHAQIKGVAVVTGRGG